MEVALSPMEFARRARRLYPEREAVVDGDKRFSYVQFLDRCDRWSSVLQGMGVGHGDRVAYIAPNTHGHLEGYYAVPQIGAVLGLALLYLALVVAQPVVDASFGLWLPIDPPSLRELWVLLGVVGAGAIVVGNTGWR